MVCFDTRKTIKGDFMEIIKYSEWKETALSIHLILQMMGKVKLERLQPQPQWNQVLLHLTPDGFTTGLIPNGERSFMISMNVRESKVETSAATGRTSSFSLASGLSTADYYGEFNRMLGDVTCETKIYTVPQEMSLTTPFEQHTDKRSYAPRSALHFRLMCIFAHNAELAYISPFRSRKIMPSMFWGTFDVSSVVFSGKLSPFPGKGVIEETAFDEQMIEFGFWPGDDNVDEPTFFILPYPFIADDLTKTPIKPDKAWFSKEKAEYFITMRDIMSYPDPEKALNEFFASSYDIVTKHQSWENLSWFNKPLP